MQGAESPDEIDGMDADDFAVGKKLGENFERDAVVGIVEGRHQDQAVGDIEVGVAGGKALAAKDDRARQGQFDDRELLAVEVRAALRRARFSARGSWLGSLRIRLDSGDDCRRRRRSG